MNAVRLHEHGGPEVLRLEEVPDPEMRENEVLVRVRACGLNHLDLWMRRGRPGLKLDEPRILGSDVAGEVARVGSLVGNAAPGDRVVVNPGVSCGVCPQCLAGHDNRCRQYTILGTGVDGGYAEYVRVPMQNLMPYPENLDWVQAAAVPLVFLTAWNMLVTNARVQPGEDVLVLGAGSGVGSAGIQIAKLFGARVIATAGSEAKLEKARELGADEVIDHRRQDIAEEVRRITRKRGVDVVFEHVGQATWDASMRSLTTGGRLVTCGATTGPEGKTDIRYVFAKQLRIFGTYMASKAEGLQVLEHVAAGRLRPVVHAALPLGEAREAHRIMEAREQFGKVVLVP